MQLAKIAQLIGENKRLKEEIECEIGKQIQLAAAERRILAVRDKGIDPEVLKKISVLDSEGPSSQKLLPVRPRKAN